MNVLLSIFHLKGHSSGFHHCQHQNDSHNNGEIYLPQGNQKEISVTIKVVTMINDSSGKRLNSLKRSAMAQKDFSGHTSTLRLHSAKADTFNIKTSKTLNFLFF